MRWSLFDPDDYKTADLPVWLRPLHRLYLYCACRVTGNSTHALNGLLVWLPVSWLVPLAWFWAIPVIFYTDRDALLILGQDGESLDHAGDVVWVYAVGVALWLPWWALIAWLIAVVVPVQVAYWLRPAPRWIPDSALLWRRNR